MNHTSISSDLYRAAADQEASSRLWMSVFGRSITYGQLCKTIRQVGGLLARQGIRLGDRVVMSLANDGDAALLFVALVSHGVTVVQLDPETPAARAIALIRRARPALAMLDSGLCAAWSDDQRDCPVLDVVAPQQTRSRGFSALLGAPRVASALENLLQHEAPTEPPSSIPAETLAYILFTSGTTGASKGVCISHRALFSHLASLRTVYRLDRNSRILNTLMLSHADGSIQGPLLAFACGASLHRPLRFEIGAIERLLDSVYQLRITHMIVVPTMMALFVRLGGARRDAFQGGDFRSLISCGGALEPALWTAMQQAFSVAIINGYGLTETVAGGVFSGEGLSANQPGSIGRPVDCDLRIVDDDGHDAAEGELLIRGDLLMSGYFDDPERTSEALIDGWLHTGDIARQDEAGDYWICGRKKSVIIRGGLNIHPEEIAEVLNQHPAVRDAIAFGAPDPDWGETVTAMVAADASVSPEQLMIFCRERLEARKVPSRIVVTTELPTGRSGKVMIDEARALAATSGTTAGTVDIDALVLKTAAEMFGVEASRLSLATTPQSVVGWDSLAHLNLVFAIEEAFDIKLTPREIMGLDSLGMIAEIVRSR